MKIRVSCTSYLPPKNRSWGLLEIDNELKFGDFGDWPHVLTTEGDQDALLWVIFLEDLIPNDLLFGHLPEDIEKAKSTIDSALDALHVRLSKISDQYTFIAWCGWQPDSPIRFARKRTLNDKINRYLEDRLDDLLPYHKRLFLLPLNAIFSEEGFKRCKDNRNFFFSRVRLSQLGMRIMASALNDLINRIQKPAAKLLVLDCDNTLWGGVVGESGLGDILIGQDGIGNAFSTFQAGVKQLAKNGLLLAISSKNDEKDVINVFDNHSSMVLKQDDIVISKVDWRDKSIHIQEIASELGIGLNSIAFWDDNPIEREKVKQSLPQIMVVEPPQEVVEWLDTLKSLSSFASFNTSMEDRNKNIQYKAKAAFESENKLSNNYNDFLSNINMSPAIVEINEGTIGRAVQLCQKTNQMNLRLIRHDETSLTKIIENPKSISFLVKLKDKFGDHGIVGLVIACAAKGNKIAFLDTFLMSCRVLGRNIEGWIFDQLKTRLIADGYLILKSEFVSGERNSPARSLLEDYNFEKIDSATHKESYSEEYKVKLKNWDITNLEIFNPKS